MAIRDVITKLQSEGSNEVFKTTKRVNTELVRGMLPLLLQGSRKTSISSLSTNKEIAEKQISPDNIEKSIKVTNTRMNEMVELHKDGAMKTKFVLDELKIQTSLLKAIDLNTRNFNKPKQTSDLLDSADKLFNRKNRRRKAGWISPVADIFMDGDEEDENGRQRTRRSKTYKRLAEKAKNLTRLTRTGVASAGNKLMSAARGIMTSRTGQVAGTIVRQAIPRIAAVAAANPVGAAAVGVAALGYGAYKLNQNQGFRDFVGEKVANTLSFFGNKQATEAVRINRNDERGSSTAKVETVKVGKVQMPKDENVKKALEFASKEFSIPLEELLATAYQESSFNPNAKGNGSSAAGLFQFTNDTWDELRKRFSSITDKFGIGSASSGDRFDPMKSSIMYGLLRKGNMQYLQKKGLTSGNSMVDSYLAHFLGMGGAAKVLGALAAGKGNDPISNYVDSAAFSAAGNAPLMKGEDGRPRSVNDFIKSIYNKSGARADAYKEALSGNSSDKKLSPDKANPEQNLPTENKGVSSSSNTNANNAPSTASNVKSGEPAKKESVVTSLAPSPVNKSGTALAAMQRAESKESASINNTAPSSSNVGGAPSPVNSNYSPSSAPVNNGINTNVKASPYKSPSSAREVPSTIQRILDKEYQRSV